jgi:hypothetical protein
MCHYRPRFAEPDRPDASVTLVRTPAGAELDVADPALAAELGPGVHVIKLRRGAFDTMPLSLLSRQTLGKPGVSFGVVQPGRVVGMTDASWDPRGEALSALRAIAADPQYGTEALSSAQTMTNLLKDMLPDAPREANVLIAATGAGVPAALAGFVAQGMDVKTAARLAAGALADRTALTADACAWATGSLATVLIPAQAATQPDVAGSEPTAAITIAPGRSPGRPGISRAGLGLAAASLAGAGALATILACAFSFIHLYNSDGTYSHSESLFSFTGGYGGAWFWLAPVIVAVLSAAAGLVLALSRASWLRGAAAGVAAASGAAVICYFAAWQFMLGPAAIGNGSGPAGAEKLGAFGGLLLLVAGVLGLVAAARDRSRLARRADRR